MIRYLLMTVIIESSSIIATAVVIINLFQAMDLNLQQKRGDVAFMRRKDLDQSLIRKYLTEALLQLMEKKNYDEISVSEIAKRAGVHRATFYRHFSSREDILRCSLSDILKESEGDRNLLQKDFASFILPVFQTLYHKKEQILLLYRSGHAGLLMDVLKDYFNFDESMEADEQDRDGRLTDEADGLSVSRMTDKYRAAYRIGGIYSCLLLWFSHDMKETPEEMAQIAAAM